MKPPDSFIPDSFEPDPPKETQEIVKVEPIASYRPKEQIIDLPAADFHEVIDSAIQEINDNPSFFLGIRNWWIQRKVTYKLERAAEVEKFLRAKEQIEQLQLNLEHGRLHDKKTFEHDMELKDLQMQVQRCQVQLLDAATKLELLPADLSFVRKEQLLSQTKQNEAEQALDRTLREKEHEAELAIRGAVALHMVDVEKLDYITGKIEHLKLRNASPERIATMERIREQIEGRIFQEINRKNLVGGDESS